MYVNQLHKYFVQNLTIYSSSEPSLRREFTAKMSATSANTIVDHWHVMNVNSRAGQRHSNTLLIKNSHTTGQIRFIGNSAAKRSF